MCIDEHELSFQAGEAFLYQKADLCNKNLAINRELICLALNSYYRENERTLNCLDGNSPCGLMGMLWKKVFQEKVNVDVNGLFNHSANVIKANAESNNLSINIIREDPCIWLRQNTYDVIYLNCKTSASHYFDSAFSKMNDKAIAIFTTSEDPSLHWQSPNVALRHYGGFIVRTGYLRELGVRLVIAEMARAAARHGKGIKVMCCLSVRVQQSFTIIVKVVKGVPAALESLKLIKKVLHCSMCEDRVFAPNSEYVLESPASLLSCNCRENVQTKITNLLGPVWSGDIFDVDFIDRMIAFGGELPWGEKTKSFLTRVLQEARCDGPEVLHPEPQTKRPKLTGCSTSSGVGAISTQPSFYFSSHKHHPPAQHILKVQHIVSILRKKGYRASRTHFEPECVRTNARLQEFVEAIKEEVSRDSK